MCVYRRENNPLHVVKHHINLHNISPEQWWFLGVMCCLACLGQDMGGNSTQLEEMPKKNAHGKRSGRIFQTLFLMMPKSSLLGSKRPRLDGLDMLRSSQISWVVHLLMAKCKAYGWRVKCPMSWYISSTAVCLGPTDAGQPVQSMWDQCKTSHQPA